MLGLGATKTSRRENSCKIALGLCAHLLQEVPEVVLAEEFEALEAVVQHRHKRITERLADQHRSCDFTAHMCTGIILSNYKLFVNPLSKLISIEHVIIGSRTQWKTM